MRGGADHGGAGLLARTLVEAGQAVGVLPVRVRDADVVVHVGYGTWQAIA